MPTLRDIIRSVTRPLGFYAVSTGRLGVEIELDLARLTHGREVDVIFDVGGNFGQTARRLASAFPGATIYTFEPVPSSYAHLLKSVRRYRRIKPYNIALGESRGVASVFLTADAGTNSIKPVRSATGKVDVPIDSADNIAEQLHLKNIDLLKIDVEGYELPVLRGCRRLLAERRIRFIYAECVLSPNDDLPHTDFFALHRVLDQAGFAFVGYYAESFFLRRGCAHGNVLYGLRSALPERAPGRVKNICP